MKNYYFITIAAFVAALFSATAFAASASSNFDRELSTAAIITFTLSNTNGAVEILPGDGDKIVIHAVKKVTGPLEGECTTLLDKLQIEVSQTSSAIKVKHSKFDKMLYNASIEYTIHLPANIKVEIETTNGSITCKERAADTELETTNGEIELTNCIGNVSAVTTNGAITAQCATPKAKFESTNGSLHLEIKLSEGGKLSAETTNGSIHLRVPKDVSASVSAETTNGKINADSFESSLSFNRRHTEANGKLGAGSGTIKLETTNGRIEIDTL